MALTDNLSAFFEFENDGNDATANALNLTNNNSATFAAGKVGQATSLADASLQYWSRADNVLLEPGDNNFSITAWVNLASKPGNQAHIVSKYTTTGDQRGYALYWDTADAFTFIFSADGTSSTLTILASTAGAPNLSTWYFLFAGYDATANEMRLSVNNGPVDTASQTGGPFNGSSAFHIGALGNPIFYFDGLIDQVGFWKGRLLSADDITQLYNNGNGLSYAAMSGPAQTLMGAIVM